MGLSFPCPIRRIEKLSLRPLVSRLENPKNQFVCGPYGGPRNYWRGLVFHLRNLSRSLLVPAALISAIITTGCGSANWSAAQRKNPPSVADVATSSYTPKVLLFVGAGTSSGDVAATKTILYDLGLSFATVNSGQLDGMSESSLTRYKLFLVPGGDAVTISDNLSRTATANVHNAIVNGGLHYLGICAGAFFAGHSIHNFLSLAGTWFNFYPEYFSGIEKAALEIHGANGVTLDQYWERGPQLSGWGAVVAKYPDGLPAIVESRAGNGWAILSGVHPEAPQSWRGGMYFTTSAAVDNAYAKTLVLAALNGTWLPHF
jgi:Biotin-protein ligase, N terminal